MPMGSTAASAGTIVAAVLAGLGAGAGVAAAVAVMLVRRRDHARTSGTMEEKTNWTAKENGQSHSTSSTRRGSRSAVGSWHEADLTPPLPADVVRLLRASRLCFLSTFCDDHPHLSLMNFTYHADDEVIILSTRRDTKKYKLVQEANHVALLVHEFPCGAGTDDATETLSPRTRNRKVTITLNGSAIIQEGAQAEKYRKLHVENNPNSKTFIVGPGIAIITVRVRTARICNIRDEVTFWDITESASNGS